MTTWSFVQKTWFGIHSTCAGRWGWLDLDRWLVHDWLFQVPTPRLKRSQLYHIIDPSWNPLEQNDYIIDVQSKTISLSRFWYWQGWSYFKLENLDIKCNTHFVDNALCQLSPILDIDWLVKSRKSCCRPIYRSYSEGHTVALMVCTNWLKQKKVCQSMEQRPRLQLLPPTKTSSVCIEVAGWQAYKTEEEEFREIYNIRYPNPN